MRESEQPLLSHLLKPSQLIKLEKVEDDVNLKHLIETHLKL